MGSRYSWFYELTIVIILIGSCFCKVIILLYISNLFRSAVFYEWLLATLNYILIGLEAWFVVYFSLCTWLVTQDVLSYDCSSVISPSSSRHLVCRVFNEFRESFQVFEIMSGINEKVFASDVVQARGDTWYWGSVPSLLWRTNASVMLTNSRVTSYRSDSLLVIFVSALVNGG